MYLSAYSWHSLLIDALFAYKKKKKKNVSVQLLALAYTGKHTNSGMNRHLVIISVILV